MEIHHHHPLHPLTTMGVGGYAATYVRFDTVAEIQSYLRQGSLRKRQFLVLGGGSNLLFVNGYAGVLLHPQLLGITVLSESADSVLVSAMAGEKWDDLVQYAVHRGWGGIENLSHIPGSVGASAIQNIGAYGVEAQSVIESVDTISIADGHREVIDPQKCGFAYRYSHFKGPWQQRYIVTAVSFRLTLRPRLVDHYCGVADEVARIGAPTPANLRRAIIRIRRRKLPDPEVIGNAGSFFKNPIVPQSRCRELTEQFPDLPCYPLADGRFKLAAGWLIDSCGWRGAVRGRAGVYRDHALVLVNHGQASGQEIFELSEAIRRSVSDRFGLELEREVQVVRE